MSSSLEQLQRARDAGLIDQATFDAAVAAVSAHQSGSGALAQGQGATAVGEGGVNVQGDNPGVINLGVLIQQGQQRGAGPQALRRAYLARVLVQNDQLPLFKGDGAQVLLSSVYTALLTQRTATNEPRQSKEQQLANLLESRYLSAVEVLDAEPRLVLLGGPGSGKSTFVAFVSLALAGEGLALPAPNLSTLTAPLPAEPSAGDKPPPPPPPPQPWRNGALLPVQVVLRDLASQLPPPGCPVHAETMWEHIVKGLQAASLGDFAPTLRQELLQRGGLILLDGLDEVPDAHERREQIQQVVQDFAATYSRCRYLVTCRTYAYQRQAWTLDGFAAVPLQPFSPGQIGQFIDAWYAHMVTLVRLTETDARQRADKLKLAVERNPRIRELAERPLLLTLMARLQTTGDGSLPEKPEALYHSSVDMLLDEWESLKVVTLSDGRKAQQPSLTEWLKASRQRMRQQLNRLAFEAHRDQPELRDTADIREERVIAALAAASERPDVQLLRLTEYLRDRAGLLAANGVGVYQFPHRSFQEYLAACHLTDDDFPEQVAEFARHDPDRWREAAILAGAKAERGVGGSAWSLADALCPEPVTDQPATAADQWGALLAGQVLADNTDLRREVPRRHAAKLQRVRDWQLRLLRGSEMPARERALAGRTLAVLGDPRPEVSTLDAMPFCIVPPGPFTMGNRESASDEGPAHMVDMEQAFAIGRYQVTVAQWTEFVESAAFKLNDPSSLQGRSNEPVVHVTWYESLAFCAYLTKAWRAHLPPGWEVTLPSEAQWEMAARGGADIPVEAQCLDVPKIRQALADAPTMHCAPNPFPRRDYPWGLEFAAERANAESSIGGTSAAGCFGAAASPIGCEDMVGNVWEWTRSLWGTDGEKPEFEYPYANRRSERENLAAADDTWRVMRGGSWSVSRGGARCGYRYRLPPKSRVDFLGFRVVVCSSSVS